MLASIVISTHQRSADVLETLRDLEAVIAESEVEVIVVANACTDDTIAATRELVHKYSSPLTIIDEPRAGLSIARNRGIAAAAGEMVIFIDDDISPDPGWLGAYIEAFGDPKLSAAGGPIRARLAEAADGWVVRHRDAPVVQGLLGHYDLGDEVLDVVPDAEPPTPYGGNLAIRRDVPSRCGLFREDLGYGPNGVPGEETDYLRRIAESGLIRYVPGASVVHRIQLEKQTRASFVAYQERQGRLEVRLAARLTGWGRRRELVRLWAKTAPHRGRMERSEDPARVARWARRRGRFLELGEGGLWA